MHEMSITMGVIEICEAHAGGRPVTEVVLEIGELSGVVPEAIEFCFEACSRGTLLEGARLRLETVAGRALCPACAGEVAVSSLFDPCPDCGTFGFFLLSGQEMRVKEIELEDPPQ